MSVRIATAIANEVDRHAGRLDRIDVAGLRQRFRRWEYEVDAQLEELRVDADVSAGSGSFPWEDVHPAEVGRYRLVRRLGKGGAGAVFLAHDPRLERDVAIKILRKPWLTEREARAQAALWEHPNITKVLGVEEHDGIAFIVMEFVPGISLDQLLAECRRPSRPESGRDGHTLTSLVESSLRDRSESKVPEENGAAVESSIPQRMLGGPYFRDLAQALAGVARGLHHAHEHGIVHRDVKPANLLLEPCGRVKLTDFSHAKGRELARISRTGRLTGTVGYASPEQVAGRSNVGPPTDIWSLGATLYELVTLRPAFPGRNESEVLGSILAGRFDPPRALNPRVPVELERIVLACLRPDPHWRHANASLLADDLERFACGEAVRVESVGLLRRLAYHVRHPSPRTVLALAASGLVVGAIGAIFVNALLAQHNLRVQRDLRIASFERSIREGLRDADSEVLGRAMEGAVHMVVDHPRDPLVRGSVQAALGRVALRAGNLRLGFALLAAGEREGGLTDHDRLELARASFLNGHEEEALRIHEALPTGLADPLERPLVAAFRAAHALKCLQGVEVLSCVPTAGLVGFGEAGLLVLHTDRSQTIGPEYGCATFYPEGLRAGGSVTWRIPVRNDGARTSVVHAVVADLRGHGVPELLLATEHGLLLGVGPFSISGPSQWAAVEVPVEDEIDAEHLGLRAQVAVLPARGGTPPWILWGRHRTVTALVLGLGCGSPRVVRSTTLCRGSDVKTLRVVEWNDEPAVVVGQGSWMHWNVELHLPDPRRRAFRRMGSATMGLVTDALAVTVDVSGPVLLCVNEAGGAAFSDVHFGRSSCYGWPVGLFALRLDGATGSLLPTATYELPRRLHGPLRIAVVDLDRDGSREVLLSHAIPRDGSDPEARERTHVLALDPAGDLLRPRCLLPGRVVAVLPAPGGARDLLVGTKERSHRLVRLP